VDINMKLTNIVSQNKLFNFEKSSDMIFFIMD